MYFKRYNPGIIFRSAKFKNDTNLITLTKSFYYHDCMQVSGTWEPLRMILPSAHIVRVENDVVHLQIAEWPQLKPMCLLISPRHPYLWRYVTEENEDVLFEYDILSRRVTFPYNPLLTEEQIIPSSVCTETLYSDVTISPSADQSFLISFSEIIRAGDNGDQCSICLESFVEGHRVTSWSCCHLFHIDCIDHWLKMQTTCPNCRVKIFKRHRVELVYPSALDKTSFHARLLSEFQTKSKR